MIVGLCGSHGTGKSTVVKEARERGIVVDDRQLARTAQAKLGWASLTEAQKSLENMWLLQNAVFHALMERDEQITEENDGLTLVERTPADAWAYARLWLFRQGIDPDADHEAIIYRKTLENHAKRYYSSFVILPIRSEIPFVAEANRADLESREFVDVHVRDFIMRNDLPHYTLKSLGPSLRGAELESYLIFLKGQQ